MNTIEEVLSLVREPDERLDDIYGTWFMWGHKYSLYVMIDGSWFGGALGETEDDYEAVLSHFSDPTWVAEKGMTRSKMTLH